MSAVSPRTAQGPMHAAPIHPPAQRVAVARDAAFARPHRSDGGNGLVEDCTAAMTGFRR